MEACLCLLLAAGVALGSPTIVVAATNAVRGGIGGVDNGTLLGGDGSGTAQFTIQAVDLVLRKEARDAAGSVLPDGAIVIPGQVLSFVLFVENPTSAPAADIQVTDLLDESQFTYVPGTLEETTVAVGTDAAGLWAAAWMPVTDAVGDDVASVADTGGAPGPDRITIGLEPVQPNVLVAIPPGAVRAIRFQASVN